MLLIPTHGGSARAGLIDAAFLASTTGDGRGLDRFAMLIGGAAVAAIVVVLIASRVRVVNLMLGFAATVAMWALGFAAMTAPGLVAGEVLFALTLVCIAVAGFIAARRGGAGASGLVVGLVCASANLLIVGGLFGGRPSISVEIERQGARAEVPLFVPREGSGDVTADLGLTLAREDADREAGEAHSLRVVTVAPKSSAENSLILPGDRITRIGVEPANDPAQLASALAAERTRRASLLSQGAPWVIGLFAIAALLGWIGDRIGRGSRASAAAARALPDPAVLFASVAAVAVFLLLITGGLVTGLEAGLAVPDWPNSFGHNMLLYPLSEMKGGVYYEHAHRLFGMLVGLTSLVLVSAVFRSDRRASVRALALLLLAAVIVQGALGALRVTGAFSMSEHRADHAPSLALAVVHGVLGQGILAGMVVLAAMLSPRWREGAACQALPGGGTMRRFASTLVVLLLGQLVLGACYRHLYVPPDGSNPGVSPMWALHGHITLAVVIMVLALITGFRAKAFAREASLPVIPGLGRALHIVVGVQILLGIGALVAIILRKSPAIPSWEVIVTTVHQATGAALLAMALLLAAWSWRLVRGAGAGAPAVTARSSAKA